MENLPLWNPAKIRQSPLFEPLHSLLMHFENKEFPTLQELNALLGIHPEIKLHSGKPLHFVEQGLGKLAFESQYEPRCYLSGEVQTRENNLHDLFNALVWLRFPLSKAAINLRHYRALAEATLTQDTQRGRVRDMATLFDESGVIIACSKSILAEMLCNFKWKELFWLRRDEVKTAMGFYLFGHGLYEKALNPYVGMTGQGLLLPVEDNFFTWSMSSRMEYLDVQLSLYLNKESHCQNTHELTPGPFVGHSRLVNGQCTGNLL